MSQLEIIQLKRDLRQANKDLGKFKGREAKLRRAMERILETPGKADIDAIVNEALGRNAVNERP